MVKVYSLDQLNQVFPSVRIILRNLIFIFVFFRWVLRDFRPWVQPWLAEWSTTHCLAGPLQLIIMSHLTFRVSPAPAPRSILVKKVTFQRREGESSSGSRLDMTWLWYLNPCLKILLNPPTFQRRQPWCKSVRLPGHGKPERRHCRQHCQGTSTLPQVFYWYCSDRWWCMLCLPK